MQDQTSEPPSSSNVQRDQEPHLSSSSPSPATTTTFPPPRIQSESPVIPPSSSSSRSSRSSLRVKIYGVALVGFDHSLGPTVEFLYPQSLERSKSGNELKDTLPFLALPDGAHAREEDYTYFHLYLPNLLQQEQLENDNSSPSSSSTSTSSSSSSFLLNETVFGISCNRQIQATELLNKGSEITRSTVQKAIVVLASKPIFGSLRDKLGVITRSFFAQRDFGDKTVLKDLYHSFDKQLSLSLSLSHTQTPTSTIATTPVDNTTVNPTTTTKGKGKGKEERRSFLGGKATTEVEEQEEEEEEEEEEGIYMGTFLRELVHKFRFKTLMLLKLLMLQRRVLFYSTTTTVEQLCAFQYSLVALIPNLLTCLQDSASPSLSNRTSNPRNLQKPTSLKTSDKNSLLRYLGLPLELFGEQSFFQPYLPLQQIELLEISKSYLVGTTNSIIQQQRGCNIDVVVNLDTTSLQILNPLITPLITLTPADRKWMDELVTTVDQSYNNNNNKSLDPNKNNEGIMVNWLERERNGVQDRNLLLSSPELESYNPASFNESFIKAFKSTRAFKVWDLKTDQVIFDLVEPKHPMEGKTNPFEDVGIRLVSGLHSLQSSLPPLPEHYNNLLVDLNGMISSDNKTVAVQHAQEFMKRGGEGIWGAVKWATTVKSDGEETTTTSSSSSSKTTNGGGGSGEKVAVETTKGGGGGGGGTTPIVNGLAGFWGKARNSTLFSSSSSSSRDNTPIPSPNPNPNPQSQSLSLSNDEKDNKRPPSPTLSIVSTTSSTKSSSALVTVQAQQQQQQQSNLNYLTTPPLNNNNSSTFLSTSPTSTSRGGLRPLSTAVAATPATPSSSSSTNSNSGGTGTGTGGGFSSFFGGIKRSLLVNEQQQPSPSPNHAQQTTATTTTTSTRTSGGTGGGGGGGTRGMRLPSTVGTRNPSSSSNSNSKNSPTLPVSLPLSPNLTTTGAGGKFEDRIDNKDEDEDEDEEVVLNIRNLDLEREEEEEQNGGDGVEEAMKRLEGKRG
ncbi:hypothetical protein JCM5350_001593 [Sporobolomyces pararoseus]